MCSIIPTSELISIFISRQFTMLSFNIGILHNLHKHNAKQRLKRCRRQQKSSRFIINDDCDCFCVSSVSSILHLHICLLHNNGNSILQLPDVITFASDLTFLCKTELLLLHYI